jgi:hypothetical protein
MRQEFREVQVQNKTYLYPFPVIKGNKYLIEIPKEFSHFVILSLENGFLYSPDQDKNYLNEIGVHTDGNTPIFKINFQKLSFEFLSHSEVDPDKAKTLHQLISKKIIAVLEGEESAKDKLKHRFEMQLKCSTCQSLGIEEPEIKEWLESL